MASDLAALIADRDFQSLGSSDQRAVLARATGDQSFRSLSDDDTQEYVSRAMQKIQLTRPDLVAPPGVPMPKVNMQESAWAPGSNRNAAGIAGMPGASPSLPSAGPGYTAAVGVPAGIAATAMGGSVALPFLAGYAAKHPIVTAMIGSKVIQQARQIPTVGHYIPSWAEFLPFLYNPKAVEGGAPIERDATRGNMPYAGEEMEEPSVIERDATRMNVPYAGEEELSPEEKALAAIPRPLRPSVGTPEQWQTYEDQMARLKREASDAGTYSAARGKVNRKLNYQQRIERSY